MTRRPLPLALFVLTLSQIIGWSPALSGRTERPQTQPGPPQSHVDWVAETLERMETVKVGMTRGDLLKVFTTEGGLSFPLQQRFVSRDCRYFKVDVRFRAVGRPERDSDGRQTWDTLNQDVIVEISRPYLQFSILD